MAVKNKPRYANADSTVTLRVRWATLAVILVALLAVTNKSNLANAFIVYASCIGAAMMATFNLFAFKAITFEPYSAFASSLNTYGVYITLFTVIHFTINPSIGADAFTSVSTFAVSAFSSMQAWIGMAI